MKNRIFITLSILLAFGLVGCGNNGNGEEVTENTEEATEVIMEETTENESLGTEIVEKKEYIVVVDSINENGLYVYPYEDTCELWDIDDKFYIDKKDVSVIKGGKSSIYDIVYFYDGLIISFEGEFDKKSSHTAIIPTGNSKILVELTDEYKELNVNNNFNIDETPVDIVDKDNLKADIEYNGYFCKFTYPAKYDHIKIITHTEEGEKTKVDVTVPIKYDNGSERNVLLFTIERTRTEDGSRYDNKVTYSGMGFNLAETDEFSYDIVHSHEGGYDKEKKELIDYIISNIIIF